MKSDISGYGFSDAATIEAMKEIHARYNYVIDPHGAVGYLALKKYQAAHHDHLGIILETAHPSKFIEDVESILEKQVPIPERLAVLHDAQKVSVKMNTQYDNFKAWLLGHF